jgi:hypothetical protein
MNLIALTIAQIEEVIRLAETRAPKSALDEVEKPVVSSSTTFPTWSGSIW